jgi:hypothetical protein
VHDRLGATGRMAGTSQYFAASNDTRAHGALSLLMLSSVEEALTVARLMREVLRFLRRTVPKKWDRFRDRITDNFRIISPDDFRVVA